MVGFGLNLSLSQNPLVVATVTRPEDLDFLASGPEVEADILEYRIDNLIDHLDRIEPTIEKAGKPALITVRRPDEGGAGDLSSEHRLELYERFLPHAALIDLELASLEESSFVELATSARKKEIEVIGSYHDFNGWPMIETIVEAANRSGELPLSVVKIAVVIDELWQLLALAEEVGDHLTARSTLISAMGMGELGKLSRLVLARAGSCLNYGYLHKPNAPGQWAASELRRLIQEIQ